MVGNERTHRVTTDSKLLYDQVPRIRPDHGKANQVQGVTRELILTDRGFLEIAFVYYLCGRIKSRKEGFMRYIQQSELVDDV